MRRVPRARPTGTPPASRSSMPARSRPGAGSSSSTGLKGGARTLDEARARASIVLATLPLGWKNLKAMIIKPKVRGFVCVTAHPAGCAAHVDEWISHVKSKGPIPNGPRKVLVIGASTGYGLASRITAAFGSGAGDARHLLRAPVRGGPHSDSRLVQFDRVHEGGPRRRPLRAEHQRRRVLRRDQGPGAGDHQEGHGTGRPGRLLARVAPQDASEDGRRAQVRPEARRARRTPTRPSTPTRGS